jgi:serine/threonine protein kinase
LSDFGGAKIIIEEIDLKHPSFKGTPNWMAPETIKLLQYTRFSDIWSLGCTIIEMITGKYYLFILII